VPLRYIGPPRPIPPIWKPSEFRWGKHQAYKFDYFLIRSMISRDELFVRANGEVVLLARSGWWFLWGKAELKRKSGP
jgi:hypothetical protein